ncbi:ABC transporter ATP-binding protein [Peribacillus frigoritolerans]|uniref:ABC transporter ATP-binding protein n=1 Tax=Peribacillus frigoritolerans TaxID=450367 RepID=UPI0020BE406E|nr:ABC transporter ATP-binding protein [Peribacillus frigoritolerans]
MKRTIIKTSHLCKSFSMGKEKLDVINDMNLEIYEGDFTIIMGSSGAGKSTLLYAISTMDQYSQGKVELLGKDITSFKENQITNIRKNDIAFIFQGINLLPDMTLFENVAFNGYSPSKSKKSVNEKALSLLKKLGLEKEVGKYPSEVSGGQKQRTAIARALINKPKIIFADEPTGALNSSVGTVVLDILTQLNNEGQSIVMVTHDLKAATRGNRIIYLKDGRIDGELNLDPFGEDNLKEREEAVYKFLNDKNW